MAASSLGQYDSLSLASMKAHKNPKQLRVVVPSSVSFLTVVGVSERSCAKGTDEVEL